MTQQTQPTKQADHTLATSEASPSPLPGTRDQVQIWAHPHDVEAAALQQLRNIGALPWVVGVRVMPDVHLGKGATVGSVIAMSQAVAPAAVGVDIGCGMAAVKTTLRLEDLPDDLHPLRSQIERAVPVGFAGHQRPLDGAALVGGGGVASGTGSTSSTGVGWGESIQCHHNYVAEETYDGIDVLVTRKGAIRAGSGDLGLIPGSMGTGSYVVRGLGNEASYCSASHGAGRRMSRNQARKRFTEADLAAQTAGVECRKDAGVVDEIPAAYKDLDAVIGAQSDLVEVVARLTTLLCVKG
ncbi:MAG: RtcB family protein [Actinomycetales bacterium]|nr:RtcB family protein [Actinomycetales bacterium]